jgi:hypothetical protein
MKTPAEYISSHSAREIPSLMATLATYEGLFGPYHPQTLGITTALAVALCASGSRVDGRRLLERAIGDLTKYHGKHHPVRMQALEAWSTLLCEQGDWKSALPVLKELLDCRSYLMGHDHPKTLAVRNDFSATLSLLTSASQSISS